MRWAKRERSLKFLALLWIILPVTLVVIGLIAAGGIAYQRVVDALLIQQQRRLATLSAVSIEEVIQGYLRVLETLGSNPDVISSVPETRDSALQASAESLDIFNAGVLIVNPDGELLSTYPPDIPPFIKDVRVLDSFDVVWRQGHPQISNILQDSRAGDDVVIFITPVKDEVDRLTGALLGAVYLGTGPFGEPLRKLTVSSNGFAYLVDGRGRVIFHPEPSEIGQDYQGQPFVRRVMAGESGGLFWTSSEGERLVEGFAPIRTAGWGLIVQDSWDEVIAPARVYGVVVVGIGLAGILLAVLFSWWGSRRILTPIQQLAEQTTRLANGESVNPVDRSGILEMDALETAFLKMGGQINAYRAGLRRYVRAITKSQEEERQHIAREIHDETIQSLLAILRRLELFQASESVTSSQARLAEISSMVTEALSGLRQITRDMRPLVLEDLGLVPALQGLVRNAREGLGAVPNVRFSVIGDPVDLDPDVELSLYRITQEALANIRKHAAATQLRVELSFLSEEVKLEVFDNGEGFEVPVSLAELTQQGNFGLMGIQERVWAIGGELSIQSTPKQGTHLCVEIPLAISIGPNGPNE